MLFSINDISTGSLKIICTKDICNSAVGLNTALLQISFFWHWNLWKYWSKIAIFFIGNPKICLSNCFSNTCVPPEIPKRGILFLGLPGTSNPLFPTSILPPSSVESTWHFYLKCSQNSVISDKMSASATCTACSFFQVCFLFTNDQILKFLCCVCPAQHNSALAG